MADLNFAGPVFGQKNIAEPLNLGEDSFTASGPLWNINEDKEESLLQSMSVDQEPLKISKENVQAIQQLQKSATLQEQVGSKAAEVEEGNTSQQMADFAVPVTLEQWRMISTAASQSDNPDEELQRYAAALTYGREYGVDTETALQNLNEFNMHQLGKPYSPTATNTQAVVNSFKISGLAKDQGKLYEQFYNADMADQDVTGLAKQIEEYSNQIASLEDYAPRYWFIDWLKLGGKNSAYAIETVGAGLAFGGALTLATGAMAAASGLTLATNGLAAPLASSVIPIAVGTITTAGVAVGTMLKAMQGEQGSLYYDLRQQGVPKNIANYAATASGMVTGVAEALFNQIGGALLRPLGVKNFSKQVTSKIFKKLAESGLIGVVSKGLIDYFLEGGGEFGQEWIQSVSRSLAEESAYAISDIVPPDKSMSILEQAFSEGLSGFAVGLLMGIPGAGIDTAYNIQEAATLKKTAKSIDSKEAFVTQMKEQKPDGITDKDWAETTSKLWENAHKGKAVSTSIQTEESATNELDYGAGAKPKGAVRRLSTGELYTKEDGTPTTDTSGAEHHRLLVGDPATGARYGHIEYAISDNTLTINDVRVKSGYENIRKESILSLAKQYPGYDIQWEAKGENLQSIKDSIIEANPRGKEAGVQYFDGVTNVDERIALDKTVKDSFTNLSASQVSAGSTLLQLAAKAKGMDTGAFINSISKDGKLFEAITSEQLGNPNAKGAVTFDQDMKALVYVTEKGDFATFVEETFHILRRTMGQTEQLQNAFKEAAKTPELIQYINDHRPIFGDRMFASMSAEDIALSLSDFTDTWTRVQEEAAAKLYLSYRSDGTVANKQLEGIFKRIAQWMNQIYQGLKHTVSINPEIAKVFDSFVTENASVTDSETVSGTEQVEQETQLNLYHGSGSSFDKFSTDFIGNGEGMQAFGWGIYLSESETIAKGYAKRIGEHGINNLSISGLDIFKDRWQTRYTIESDGKAKMDLIKIITEEQFSIYKALDKSMEDGLKYIQKVFDKAISNADTSMLEVLNKYRPNSVEDIKFEGIKGRYLYNASLSKGKELSEQAWLDWYEPVPVATIDMVTKALNESDIKKEQWEDRNVTGAEEYREKYLNGKDGNTLYVNIATLLDDEGGTREGSLFLAKAGIPGVRYPIGSISGKKVSETGKSNYVVFDDKSIDIKSTTLFQEIDAQRQYDAVVSEYHGTEQWMKAPNGKDTNLTERQWVQVRTPAFLEWFGDWMNDPENASKVVDENGEPLVVYHGTGSVFTEFDVEQSGKNFVGLGDYGFGIYLTQDPKYASKYAMGAKGTPNIIPAYLSMQNPLIVRKGSATKELERIAPHARTERELSNYVKELGYDGIIVNDGIGDNLYVHEAVVFSPTQIKSVNNQGTWDAENPNILFQEDGKPVIETDFPKRPEINLFDYFDNIDEYTTIMDTWKSDLKAWVENAPDLLQFGNEDLVHVIHENVRPGEGPWRSTSFINFKGEWIPSGHSAYDTKYEAVKEGMELKDYRPDILFQESIDNKYFKALKNGDEETASKIVDDQARKKGYISGNDFRMNHKAPNGRNDYDVNLSRIEDTDLIPDGFWEHPSWYAGEGEMSSFYSVKTAIDRYKKNGKANIRLYRAIPKNIKENEFRNGDWVTPDRSYAENEGGLIPEGYRIIMHSVPIEHVWWDVNSIAELGFDDGKDYVYRDTKNNRKLNDTIVYDYDGNIVPPSKRFNYRAYETFFQEENREAITEQILEDARGFETWEGMKYYYESLYGTDMWGDALDEAYQSDEWYQAVFNEANGISETAAKAVDPQMSPEARLADEKQKDGYIKEKLSTDEGIKAFMEKLGWVLNVGFDRSSPSMEDRKMAETVQNLRETLPEMVHPTILSNAKRVGGGKTLTERAIKSIRTLMTGDGIRYYRDIYADVMEDPQLKPQVIDERLPSIESPGYNLTGFSITDRIKLADSIEAAPLKKAILSGKETLEGSAEKVIKVMDREIDDSNKQIEKLEQELKDMEDKLSESEMWHFHYAKQYSEASRSLDAEMKQIRKLTNDNMQVPEAQMKSATRLQAKVDLLHDQMMKNRASERVNATVKRHEALAELKEKLKEKQKTKDEAKKVRAYKLKLARKIMVKPSDAINYDQAQLIYNIQATLDPVFRQKSMELEIDGEQQRVTIDEAREALEGVSDEELQMAMGKRLYERIIGERKPLNDWTIEDLEQTLETVANLRTEGRAVLAAKMEQKQIIAQNYQDSIIRSLMATGKYTSQPLVGTKQDQKERNHPRNIVRASRYSTYPMRAKAMMMDNGTQGSAYKLLVTMKRAAQNAEWKALERRMEPVYKVMKSYEITEKDLYQTVQISLGERMEEYTYSHLMYAWLSQHDQSNRNAVAYGNLISKDEKIALNHDNDLIRELGDSRYRQLMDQVQYHLETQDESGGYMAVVKAVQEDFNAQAPRLNEIAIREFNKAMRVVEQYLPIHRKEFSGADMRQQVAEDLFNAKAGSNATGVAKGFQKDRIFISPDHQTPVNLDLMGVWNKSARQQEHFIAFAEYGRTLNRVFKNLGSRDLENAINRTLGKEMYQDVTEYMNQVINPQIEKKLVGMEKGVKFMRGNLGAAYLIWKMGGLVLQAITSPMPYLGYIRADRLIKSYFDIFAHPIASIEFINSKSLMMKNRTMNVIIDQILQQSKTYTDNRLVRLNQKQQEIGSMGLTLVDRYAVAGGWMAAYQQKLGELEASGMVTTEADAQAVVYADDLVLKVQPTGDSTELAPLFTTGSEFARAFTQFQTSLNVIWANLTYDVPTAFKDAKNKTLPDAVRKAQFSHAVGTMVGYALAGALLGAVAEGHDEDDDAMDKLRNWIYWSFTQATASVPLVGDMVDNIVQSAVTGDNPVFFGDEFFPGVTKVFKGVVNLTQVVENLIQGEMDKVLSNLDKALSNLGQGAGYMTGLPVSGYKQLKKAITEDPGALLGR